MDDFVVIRNINVEIEANAKTVRDKDKYIVKHLNAEWNFDYLKSLVYTTSKISFCILFVVGIPLAFNINWVLDLWLDEVPHLSNVFAILFLVNGILNALSMPFNFTVLSSGRIRNFQLVTALFFLMDLPVTYVLFKHGFPAPTVLVVKICAMVAILFVRVYFASRVVPSIKIVSFMRIVLSKYIVLSSVKSAYFKKYNTGEQDCDMQDGYSVFSESTEPLL